MNGSNGARERLIVASNNANKLKEFEAILGGRYQIVSMQEAGIDADIEENGTTFEENALIKAEYVAKATGSAAIADDSGLEVDALGGAPGVYSARYCGRHGDDEANNDLLLANLRDVPAPRTARYSMSMTSGKLFSTSDVTLANVGTSLTGIWYGSPSTRIFTFLMPG